MARDETEVLGKEGHECQVKALNLALRAWEAIESRRVACSNFGCSLWQ